MPNLNDLMTETIARMAAMSNARDTAVNTTRTIVRLSANAIRALHRGEDATLLLAEARELLTEVATVTADYPSVYWAGYVQDAMKEYAEAAITASLLAGSEIPAAGEIGVEDAAWLNGLAEAGSELRRDTLDALRHDHTDEAERLLALMEQIYDLLVTVDFPDSITGGLRRTTDQFRAVLERTRGDVTMSMRQARLEKALRAAETGLGRG
ncbi:MAG: haloacid dehalogenase [Thermomicrobiales bacterium]|nr:haloacid dehalogenase [Thermomicrobiales bacterium]